MSNNLAWGQSRRRRPAGRECSTRAISWHRIARSWPFQGGRTKGGSDEIEEADCWSRSRPAALRLVLLLATGASRARSSRGARSGPGKRRRRRASAASGTGKKATGKPIKIGAIATLNPGTDFTDIPNMAAAYFNCVNDNGGINGRPINYILHIEQINPEQDAAFAKKLIEGEKVVAIVGTRSSWIARSTPSTTRQEVLRDRRRASTRATEDAVPLSVNMGPATASRRGPVRSSGHGAKKIVLRPVERPGHGLHRRRRHCDRQGGEDPDRTSLGHVPIQDANSVALKLVQSAGKDGGGRPRLHACQALVDPPGRAAAGPRRQVKAWGCSTPCNTDFVADGTRDGLGRQVRRQRGAEPAHRSRPGQHALPAGRRSTRQVAFALGSFSQMGFVEARIAAAALLT